MSAATEAAFSRGYQEALDDLIAANERDGVHGMFQWIADNASDEQTRRLATAQLPGGSR